MTFPVDRLTDRIAKFQNLLRALRALMVQQNGRMAAAPVAASVVTNLGSDTSNMLSAVLIAETEDAAGDELQTIMREQYKDPTFDLTAELVAIRLALIAVLDEIDNTFPKDGAGYMLERSMTRGPSQELEYNLRSFTPAQTAGLRTVVDSVIALIEA